MKLAEGYLETRGALWNAGVFAFKLGYSLRVHISPLDFTGYRGSL